MVDYHLLFVIQRKSTVKSNLNFVIRGLFKVYCLNKRHQNPVNYNVAVRLVIKILLKKDDNNKEVSKE